MTSEKVFKRSLIINVKNGSARVVKNLRNRKLNLFEIRVPYKIKIRTPELADAKGLVIDTDLPIIDTTQVKM